MVRTLVLGAIGVAVLTAGSTIAASDEGQKFSARLQGFQENPSISTRGRGELTLRIDEEAKTISYRLTYERLEGVAPTFPNGVVIQAHIHVAARGVNGGVSAFLCGNANTGPCPTQPGEVEGVIEANDIVGPTAQGIDPGEATAFRELVRAIRQGYAYGNVHTTRWTGGEIRGQLREGNGHN
jgi:hypothetical protein